jgi:hypothetical protein
MLRLHDVMAVPLNASHAAEKFLQMKTTHQAAPPVQTHTDTI